MSVDPELAGLVRGAIAELAVANVSEMRMFGGIGFMLNGNLLVGASSRGLLVRVGRQAQGEALARPGTRPMEMRGRRMEGYIYADPAELSASAVKSWIELAVRHVSTLAPKAAKSKPARPRRPVRRG
jgi:TfoX/Sxy family transcriptional regulator of competence genes